MLLSDLKIQYSNTDLFALAPLATHGPPILESSGYGPGQFINFLMFRELEELSPCSPKLRPCSALSYFY